MELRIFATEGLELRDLIGGELGGGRSSGAGEGDEMLCGGGREEEREGGGSEEDVGTRSGGVAGGVAAVRDRHRGREGRWRRPDHESGAVRESKMFCGRRRQERILGPAQRERLPRRRDRASDGFRQRHDAVRSQPVRCEFPRRIFRPSPKLHHFAQNGSQESSLGYRRLRVRLSATIPLSSHQFLRRWISTKFALDLLIPATTRDVHDVTHTIVAVASRSAAKADEFVKELYSQAGLSEPTDAAVRRYGSYEELYADDNIDCVYVRSPLRSPSA